MRYFLLSFFVMIQGVTLAIHIGVLLYAAVYCPKIDYPHIGWTVPRLDSSTMMHYIIVIPTFTAILVVFLLGDCDSWCLFFS